MMRTYTMRLKATKRQESMLSDLLEHLCVLYNSALEHRTKSWTEEKKIINLYDQQKSLARFRQTSPDVKVFPSCIQRDPLRRVNLAFNSFFRRVKSKENPGYPRFKTKERYNSFTVDNCNFRIDGNNTIIITKLGGFRFKTKFRIRGTPRVLHIKHVGRRWIANLVCYLGEAPVKVAVANMIGIDLGLRSLIALSDGTTIANPRWTKQEEDRLADANRRLALKKRGSKNRAKAKERLRRVHQRIAGLRNGYLTAQTKMLVQKYDLIAHENMQIRNMVRSNFAKSITDAAWGKLIWRLNCEAEKAGKWIIPVNPRNTSQNCSKCGEKVPKELGERVHSCACGLTLGRDHNAALNILALGESAASKQNYAQKELCI